MNLITASFLAVGAVVALPQDCKKTCSTQPGARLVALQSDKDIVTTAVEAGNFKTLAAALGAAELVEALQGEGPFTVFAPTDEAFSAIPRERLGELLKPENKATLQAILKYHVVSGSVMAKDVVKLKNATTLNGQRVDIAVDEKARTVSIDGAKVTSADIQCSNGVIHVIDAVILPSTMDLVETAVANGSFNTLAAAVKAAGLVEALKAEGPLTVFAPTDEAFAKVDEKTIAHLLTPEGKELLTKILTYHVVSGRVYADQAIEAGEATTLQGGKLRITQSDAGVTVGNAKVVAADVEASNGVIHVIDTVLMPE